MAKTVSTKIVLYADPHPSRSARVLEALRAWGLVPLHASRYEEIEAHLRSIRVDGALLSSHLPGCTTAKLLQKFRTYRLESMLPVMMLGDEHDEELRRLADQNGVLDVVHPDHEPSELVRRMHAALLFDGRMNRLLSRQAIA